jgi:hypothetical protein
MPRHIPARPSGSRGELLCAREQSISRVQLGPVDDLAQQGLQRLADERPRAIADPDQIVAADGEIAEAVWASLLFAHDGPEALEPLEIDVRWLTLPSEVGLLVIEQVEEEP